jgi:hypothetical protein
MPTRVSWSLNYRTVTEEEKITLRHHMEMFGHDEHVVRVEAVEDADSPFMTHVRVEFADNEEGPANPELRSLHQLRGEGIARVEGPEPLPALVQPDGTRISPEEFQRGLVALGALLESIPMALEPVVNMVNAFGLAVRTGFGAMTPPPLPPPEEPRRTSWERILEDDDYPV